MLDLFMFNVVIWMYVLLEKLIFFSRRDEVYGVINLMVLLLELFINIVYFIIGIFFFFFGIKC